MKDIKIEFYKQENKDIWNNFLLESKNGTFLFNRTFIEYHQHIFPDSSLMIFSENKLMALLPGTIKEKIYYSHQGLTYGGIILPKKIYITEVISIFNEINSFLKHLGIEKVVYKPIPFIYHSIPSQEDIYIMFNLNAQKIASLASSCIDFRNKLPFSELRKRGIKKAAKLGIVGRQTNNYKEYWDLLNNNLLNKHGVKAIHSLSEIEYLAEKFPQNIKLFVAENCSKIEAGVLIFEENKIAHCQYISASFDGKVNGSLDFLFNFLINEVYSEMSYFDFGNSTLNSGKFLNTKLIFQKEGFGARTIVYDHYEYSTNEKILFE
ncbi:MAG: GNAT family N-acetyltransferase [Bacteroidia bacterium]|nr:GNAT family N-acetyltransferase [Bacteroidia bacterium]